MIIDRRETIRVGREVVVESIAPGGHGAVFEDDGDTGYLYAVQAGDERRILDALHVYDAGSVSDAAREHELEIVWDDAGTHAALRLNGYVHAMIGFDPPLAMCVGEFPAADGSFVGSHEWDEQAFKRVFGELESEWEWRQQQQA